MKLVSFIGVLVTFTRCTEPKYELVKEHNKHYHTDWNQTVPAPLDHSHGKYGRWNHNHEGEKNRNDRAN
jgi:hypothetical protein